LHDRCINGKPSAYVVAQIYKDGRKFSSPILTGEAGFYQDEKGYYTYQDDGPGDADPDTILQELHDEIEAAFDAARAHGAQVKTITNLGLNH
jgi:hypothetical protein